MQRNNVIGKKENFLAFGSPYMIDIFDKPRCKLNANLEAILSDQGYMKQMQMKKIPDLQQPWN